MDPLAYWRNPSERNLPSKYADRTRAQAIRSKALVRRIKKLVGPDARVLEVGCNVGRNLNALHRAGFRDLVGLELNEEAVRLGRERYPEAWADIEVHLGDANQNLAALEDDSVDVVYSMAVLEHIPVPAGIPPAQAPLYRDLRRIARRFIITIEDEATVSEVHYPRDQEACIAVDGWTQVARWRPRGLPKGFVGRLFVAAPVTPKIAAAASAVPGAAVPRD